MICPNCGKEINDQTRYCPFCENRITPEQAEKAVKEAAARAMQEGSPAVSINYSDSSTFSMASGRDLPYVVLQVTLKEKFLGTGSGNLTELEAVINAQAAKGYRLHTITTTNGGSKGMMGGDRIQATMVFEKIDLR